MHNTAYAGALVMIGLGDRQSAVKLLEQSYRDGSLWSLGFQSDPILVSLREDLNYQLFLSRIKYPVFKPSVDTASVGAESSIAVLA